MIDKGQWCEFGQDTPTLYEKCHGIFNNHRESGPLFLTSHPKDGAFGQYSVPITTLGR